MDEYEQMDWEVPPVSILRDSITASRRGRQRSANRTGSRSCGLPAMRCFGEAYRHDDERRLGKSMKAGELAVSQNIVGVKPDYTPSKVTGNPFGINEP